MAEETAAVTRQIDWESIKSEYVTTNISQKKLAEKYGVSKNAVQYRCAVDRWGDQRRQHRDRVMEKTSQRLSDAAAERMVQPNLSVRRSAFCLPSLLGDFFSVA
ncbi:MAG: hypothetical protein IIV43_00140, partial [Oscillospiraceae bacterium]|nr:hypothetical protein [Oscillospiraceae bacterium]